MMIMVCLALATRMLVFMCLFILAHPAVRAALHEYHWNVEPEWIAPDGYWREVYTINGQTPGPPIEAYEGDTIRVHVVNNLNVPISIHWHGLLQKHSPWMDGVPGVTQWPILPKDRFTYEFLVENYGAFWYHSHTMGTYDDGIRGPIVFHPHRSRPRPWAAISSKTKDHYSIEHAFGRALKFMVFGWMHQIAEASLVQWKSSAVLPTCFDSILLNGYGRVHCPSRRLLQTQGVAQANLGNQVTAADVQGCRRLVPVNATQTNPVRCDATEAPYPLWRTSSFASQDGRYAVMHVINAGTDVSYSLSIDGHSMWIVLVDGHFVRPQKVQVINVLVGSRITVVVPLDQGTGDYTMRVAVSDLHQFQILSGYGVLRVGSGPANGSALEGKGHIRRDNNISTIQIESDTANTGNTTELETSTDSQPSRFVRNLPIKRRNIQQWMRYNGTLMNGAKQGSETAYAPFPADPPPRGPANVTIDVKVTSARLSWMIGNREFKGLHFFQEPLLFKDPKVDLKRYMGTVYNVKQGDIVDIIFTTDRLVDHSLHKHLEHVWIVGSGNASNGTVPFRTMEEGVKVMPSAFNLRDPPLRDVWKLDGNGFIVVRYQVNFPAAALLHCHVESHLAAGMAIVISEGLENFDASRIPHRIRNAVHVPHVFTNTSSPNGLDTA